MKDKPTVYKKSKIPTVVGIISLIIGVAAGVFIINGKQLFRLGANENTFPANIRVSNITEDSVNISWTTDTETFGFIRYGQTQYLIDKTILPEDESTGTTHYFKLDNLDEGKKYFFVINSKGIDYYNEKQPFQFTTATKTINLNESMVIYGQVFSDNAQPQEKAIVYATVGGGSLLSTQTDRDGTWAILISSAHTKDLNSYILLDKKNTLVELEILTNSKNISSVTTYPQLAKPIPPIILKNSYDYRQNATHATDDYVPESETFPLTDI